eukprot:4646358-Alexandrium_andersonii.AAC.1
MGGWKIIAFDPREPGAAGESPFRPERAGSTNGQKIAAQLSFGGWHAGWCQAHVPMCCNGALIT